MEILHILHDERTGRVVVGNLANSTVVTGFPVRLRQLDGRVFCTNRVTTITGASKEGGISFETTTGNAYTLKRESLCPALTSKQTH